MFFVSLKCAKAQKPTGKINQGGSEIPERWQTKVGVFDQGKDRVGQECVCVGVGGEGVPLSFTPFSINKHILKQWDAICPESS